MYTYKERCHCSGSCVYWRRHWLCLCWTGRLRRYIDPPTLCLDDPCSLGGPPCMTKTINKGESFCRYNSVSLNDWRNSQSFGQTASNFLSDLRNYTKSEEKKISLGNSKSLYPYCSNALKKFQKSIWRRLSSKLPKILWIWFWMLNLDITELKGIDFHLLTTPNARKIFVYT